MAHALRTSVEDLIEGLKRFELEAITLPRVQEYMEATRLTAEALSPYTFFKDGCYTRNLIYRDRLFEVMSICWAPGQKTTIHTHNGQLGWMTVAQGEATVHNYRYVTCDHPEYQNVVGMDCLGGATKIELERMNTVVSAEDAPVYCVDKLHSIHQIENADPSKYGVISLHVYSLPIDSCIQFDMEKQKCFRRELTYHSRFGKVEVEGELQPDGRFKIIQ